MPPAIVYSNMADSVGVNGGVFADKKFFIVQRVPQRSHYVSLVENNGGRVVKLEAQADFLIADHMRHDAPVGSLSYKFIEEAIKQGDIPDEEPFHANRRKSANPATTTGPSKKSTRTPFTDDDDKLLYKLVHTANEQGYAIQGNTLYQTLAAHNPRHTFHSWRDRYVKVLSTRPPTGWETYPDASLPPFDTAVTDLPSPALPRSTARSPISSTPHSRGHVAFTEEDDQELEAWVTKKAKQGAKLGGNAIYQELAERNPRHSYHSWRDRWLRHLSCREPVDEDEDAVPLEEEDIGAVEEDVTPARQSPSLKISKTTVKRPGFRVPPGASASAQSSSKATPRSAAPTLATNSKDRTPQSTSEIAAPDLTATRDKLAADTATVSRPAATSKNQANTPVARSRNLSSPVMSQQTSAQPQLKQPCPPLVPQAHDDSAFTEDDYNDLLGMALDIQNVIVGRYQESWINWAEFRETHAAVEWRSFYERRVLPVVLGREADAERPESQSGGQWVEFWRNQGQPIDILPYKKAPEVQSEKMDDVVNQAEDTEQNTSLGSAKRKLQTRQNPAVEGSAPKRQRTATPPLAPVPVSHDEIVSISSKEAPSLSHHSDEEEEVSRDQAAGQLRREMEEDKDDRHQLTRANLARIQAENGLSNDKRAVDIKEDDENDDQADFANYLANMLPPSMKDKVLETIEMHDTQIDQDDEIDDDNDEDLPMTNEQHEHEYDPALLEIDPELDNPSYQSSAEFDTNSTNIHLDVPPTQAWEASSAPSQSQRPQRLSTQVIYEAETQPFDADIPLPPDALSPAHEVSYTTAQTDSQILSEDEFWPWIDSQVASGHAEDTVIAALHTTSFNPKLAALVLAAKGERLDVAGVWTEEDDKIAEGSDARAMRKLESKHGKGSVEARLKWLADWRRDQEIAMSGEVEA
ncbi:hypothetical protein E4T52_00027 [Aureobasidium sp. EXF-3400]|nr:hypothetical protein E4T51_01922 [Aureobasidium sp. EXF-12344]KAI4784949.1 hypothetical protein E4T52_00027 [Aureobasidium sp. EXF-3400]